MRLTPRFPIAFYSSTKRQERTGQGGDHVLRRLSITLAGLALLGAAVVIAPSPARLAAAIGCTLAAVATLALVRAPHAAVALTLALALGTQLAVPELDVPLV